MSSEAPRVADFAWREVQAALDARRDPRLDPLIARRLADAPLLRRELDALMGVIGALGAKSAAKRAQPGRLGLWLAAASVVVAVAATWALRQDPLAPAVPSVGSVARIERVVLTIARTRGAPGRPGHSHVRETFDGSSWSRTVVLPADPPSAALLASVQLARLSIVRGQP